MGISIDNTYLSVRSFLKNFFKLIIKYIMRLSPILRMANIKALVTRTKKIPATVETISVEELPKESKVKQSPGICDTIVKVKYSTLNYKNKNTHQRPCTTQTHSLIKRRYRIASN